MATLTAERAAVEAKARAMDAVEETVYAAKRAINHGKHQLEDLRDTAAYRVKRAPLTSVGVGIGAGLLLGGAIGLIVGRACKR